MKRREEKSEQGYILITLLLFVALLVIAAAAVAPSITFQIKRAREEELVHRGVQYTRAIRHYYKKFGRYPTSLDELKNTNNVHFLRKLYKDPITGQDFKLVHYGEFRMSSGTGLAGATTAAALAAGQGGSQSLALKGANTGLTATTGSTLPDENSAPTPPSGISSSVGGSPLEGQVFGGGPIIGVVSGSKKESIREFGGKDHYNEWMFVYDPVLDRGGLITTPWQPGLQSAVAQTGSGAVPVTSLGSRNNNSLGSQPQPAPTTPPAQPQPQN